MTALEHAAAAVADATLWSPAEALAVISLANNGIRAEDVIKLWKDLV